MTEKKLQIYVYVQRCIHYITFDVPREVLPHIVSWTSTAVHEHFHTEKNLKQSWLPAFWKQIQNTQEIKRTLF